MAGCGDGMSVLDILLSGSVRNVTKEPETAEVEIKRLSKDMGAPVVLPLRGLTYNEVAELQGDRQMELKVVLAGVQTPIFSDVRMARKLGLLQENEEWGAHGVTRLDVVKALLDPGEIAEISRAIQKLSGYLKTTVHEVKKNSMTGQTES